MSNLNPFRYQALCTTTIFGCTLGVLAEPAGFFKLASWWAAYVVLFALVDIVRRGWRGLLWPAMVLAVMALFHHQLLMPVIIVAWFCCVVSYLTVLALKRGPAAAKRAIAAWRERAAQRKEEMVPVSVVVSSSRENIDAVEVLERLGLTKELPQ
jgi:hypothetical protein